MRAIISGIGHFTPEGKMTNKDLEAMVDTSDEWIRTRTGIKERRILEKGRGTSYMATRAARAVLEQAHVSPDELDMIIVATITPDMLFPCTAALVQNELGASNCWGFDLSAGCSGFVFGLATACQFIETGRYRKIMVIGADKMSSVMNYEDRNTCILFGDGAGAVLLEPAQDEEGLGVMDFSLHIDGSGANALCMPAGGSLLPATRETVDNKLHFLYQDGKTVFKNAVTTMSAISISLLDKNQLDQKDINVFIPHQANRRIIDAVAEKIGLDSDRVIVNIDDYGNTTAATIPIAMSEASEQRRIRKGDWVMISAFGTGYTAGSLILKWAIE
jgi:3-oxoacyl-[acyl-carrier-protein] synthase-3